MESRIESFATAGMRHVKTRPLGADQGSMTWLDWHSGSWRACFANYDSKGGMPGRDHRLTSLVRYKASFREIGQWTFPQTVLARIAPRSVSGGAWGQDRMLYVTGHDRPELYALRVPVDGHVLEHFATVIMPTGGQAIGWDPDGDRLLWSVNRRTRQLVASKVPDVIHAGRWGDALAAHQC